MEGLMRQPRYLVGTEDSFLTYCSSNQLKQPSCYHLRLQFDRLNQVGFVNQRAINLCAYRKALHRRGGGFSLLLSAYCSPPLPLPPCPFPLL